MYVEVHKGTTTAKTSKEIFEANQSLIRENLIIYRDDDGEIIEQGSYPFYVQFYFKNYSNQ